MATWKQVRDYIQSNYNSAEYSEKGDFLSLVFEIDEERSQMVFVDRSKSEGGSNWIDISSAVGEVSKNDIFDLLEDLDDYVCGGAVKIDNEIWIRNRILLESIDCPTIDNVMGIIAGIADDLEDKYVGGDSN